MSEHLQVQFVVSFSVPENCWAAGAGHCEQRRGRTALLLTGWQIFRNFVRDTPCLLQWTSPVDLGDIQVRKTAFQVRRITLRTVFSLVCWGVHYDNHRGIVVLEVLGVFESLCYCSKYQSREILIVLCFLLSIKIRYRAVCVCLMVVGVVFLLLFCFCLFAGIWWALVLSRISRSEGLRELGFLLAGAGIWSCSCSVAWLRLYRNSDLRKK